MTTTSVPWRLPLSCRFARLADSGAPTVVGAPDSKRPKSIARSPPRHGRVGETAKDMSSKFPTIVVRTPDDSMTSDMGAGRRTIRRFFIRNPERPMSIKSRTNWIRRMAEQHKMIEPFAPQLVRRSTGKIVSYGTSSYGYTFAAPTNSVFTNINSTIVDPKNFDPNSFVEVSARGYCVIPPNSFALARTMEYFRIPRSVLTICLGKDLCPLRHHRGTDAFEPEWEGYVTLEFSNTTPLPAKIYAGEGCAQVLFFESDEVCETSYKDRGGKYRAGRCDPAENMKSDSSPRRHGAQRKSCRSPRVCGSPGAVMRFHFPVIIIDGLYARKRLRSGIRAWKAIEKEGMEVLGVTSYGDLSSASAAAVARPRPSSSIDDEELVNEPEETIAELRAFVEEIHKNAEIPIFLHGETRTSRHIPNDILRGCTASSTCSRTRRVHRPQRGARIKAYLDSLPPPFFRALVHYAADGSYSWHCPGIRAAWPS